MKKLFVIAMLSLMVSCAGVKKTTEKSSVTNIKENRELVTDSVRNTEINKRIDDAIDILVSKSNTSDEEFNKAVDKAVDEILSKLNISKQSGDNSYSLYYDLVKRELKMRTNVGETKNETQAVSKSEKTETSFEQKVDTYISKKITQIPWWLYAVAIFWFLPQIVDRIKIFANPLMGMLGKASSSTGT